MKITEIDLWHVAIPTPAPFFPSWIPGYPMTENRFTLIRLGTESGLHGWSAGASMSREHDGIGSLLGPYILGERADDLPSIRQRLREMSYLGVKLGWIEAACWDLIGKAREKPVYQILGGKMGTVKLYASTGEVKSGAERAEEVLKLVDEGFDTVKLRVHDDTLKQDLEQLSETRKRVGHGVHLGVDANQAWRVAMVADAPLWDYERALTFCKEAHQLGISWVEEPLPMDAYDDLAKLRAATAIDISGGELNNGGVAEFKLMLEKKCYDVYQPDACFAGGISETLDIMKEVQLAGARYTPHTWTNGIGFAINLQLHAASPWRESGHLEYPINAPGWIPEVRDGILSHPFRHNSGQLQLPNLPGLGFDIDLKKLKQYGSHFFRATKLRVAMTTLWDKGLRVAMQANSTRGARLRKRHEELARAEESGTDIVTATLPEFER